MDLNSLLKPTLKSRGRTSKKVNIRSIFEKSLLPSLIVPSMFYLFYVALDQTRAKYNYSAEASVSYSQQSLESILGSNTYEISDTPIFRKYDGVKLSRAEIIRKRVLPNNFQYNGKISREEIIRTIERVAPEYGIDPNLIKAYVMIESNFSHYDKYGRVLQSNRWRSSKNAIGVMQILAETAKKFGYSESDLKNPHLNIEAGIKEYAFNYYDPFYIDLEQSFGWSRANLSAISYFAGPGDSNDGAKSAVHECLRRYPEQELKRNERYRSFLTMSDGNITGEEYVKIYEQNLLKLSSRNKN